HLAPKASALPGCATPRTPKLCHRATRRPGTYAVDANPNSECGGGGVKRPLCCHRRARRARTPPRRKLAERIRMAATNVAVLVGSLRKESFSRKLANALLELAPPSLAMRIVEIRELPLDSQ